MARSCLPATSPKDSISLPLAQSAVPDTPCDDLVVMNESSHLRAVLSVVRSTKSAGVRYSCVPTSSCLPATSPKGFYPNPLAQSVCPDTPGDDLVVMNETTPLRAVLSVVRSCKRRRLQSPARKCFLPLVPASPFLITPTKYT